MVCAVHEHPACLRIEQPEQDPETGDWLHDFRPEDEPRAFRNGSYKNRMIVILAGVTVNIFIAFLLFFIVIAGQGRVADGPGTTVSQRAGTEATFLGKPGADTPSSLILGFDITRQIR